MSPKREINLLIELNRSELKRIRLFIIGLASGLVIAIINALIFPGEINQVLHNPLSYPLVIGWILLMLGYEYIFFRMVRGHLNRETVFPNRLKYLYVIDETLFPSILLIILITLEKKPILLDSPVVFLYYVLIIVSALHLSLRLSVITGLVAAAGYLAALIYVFHFLNIDPDYNLVLPRTTYYARVYYFVLSGVGAGLVAREISTRIRKSMLYLDQKENIEKLFGQQVSPEVVSALIKQKNQSLQLDATVMFFDVRGFTTLAEKMESVEINRLQNNILGPLINIVNEHRGCINQILGDGFMATFGAPVESSSHAREAIEAGINILNKLDTLQHEGAIPTLKVGIGVHSGMVSTGNIGNQVRQQYSVSGTTVIIASRIEQLNKKYETQMLISENVLNNLSDYPVKAEKMGTEILKGLAQGIEIYKIA